MSLFDRFHLFLDRLHAFHHPDAPGIPMSSHAQATAPLSPAPASQHQTPPPGPHRQLPAKWPQKVLFVCSGNICRSAYAAVAFERLLRQHGRTCTVFSAGSLRISYQRAALHMIQAAQTHGDDLTHHRSTPLSVPLVRAADTIFVMSPEHADACLVLDPGCGDRLCMLAHWLEPPALEIPDPMGKPYPAYQLAADQICCALENWLLAWGDA